MKFSRTIVLAIASLVVATSVAAPAHANILGDIVSAPIKIIKKGTGLGAAEAGAKIGQQQRDQASQQKQKLQDAENYRGCVNLYGASSSAVSGCQKVWANKLPNAEVNDNYRRCANMYGTQACQKIWAKDL